MYMYMYILQYYNWNSNLWREYSITFQCMSSKVPLCQPEQLKSEVGMKKENEFQPGFEPDC